LLHWAAVPLGYSRGARLGSNCLDRVLVPLLCRTAGVPREGVRGAITGYRAGATIATQLDSAKAPMSLFELQAWLGHSSPQSTQHYARITPVTLTKAYTDAGYFARNVRAIEVLLEHDAIDAGAAGAGNPFAFHDLGHGCCSYSLFELCPHRMACARCDFCLPRHPARRSCSRPRTGCNGCSCRSRSSTRNATPPSTTSTRSTGCSTD
jgi:hypothetical protein